MTVIQRGGKEWGDGSYKRGTQYFRDQGAANENTKQVHVASEGIWKNSLC